MRAAAGPGVRKLHWLVLAFCVACQHRARPEEMELALRSGALSRQRVRALREREALVREEFHPDAQRPWIEVSGSDPYRLVPLPGGFAGVLRGSKALVLMNDALAETDRARLPLIPTALCVDDEALWIASRYSSELVRVPFATSVSSASSHHGRLGSPRISRLPAVGVADIACGDGLVYAATVESGELLVLDRSGHVRARRPGLQGPLRLLRAGKLLLESSLFERSVAAFPLGSDGSPGREAWRIHHDGALWAFDAKSDAAGGFWVALAGSENKALVRAHGEFENIDSFAWIYRVRGASVELAASIDVSDRGVVVPKAIHLELPSATTTDANARSGRLSLAVLGSGSGRLLRAAWPSGLGTEPELDVRPALPGASDAAFAGDAVDYASPLFDGFVHVDRDGLRLVSVDPERRPALDVRLGEALFFTELMAPENPSRGTHSRFTCETCHFEGGVDGRIHYTGRGDVSVVTKPLFGLANNRPHFSRAMDPDLSSVCHNEFRVAGAGSGTDPWFSLDTGRFPWLTQLGIDRARLEPLELRAALLQFLYAFSHAPNPHDAGRNHFTDEESRGARAFAEHCESCHAARLFSDDPSSRLAPEAWEHALFEEGAPIVWARGDYAKTGVLPYVHDQGTRITSLRRLALKPRYFTNGSAATLADVLAAYCEGSETGDASDGVKHRASAGEACRSLAPAEQRDLLAFLKLL